MESIKTEIENSYLTVREAIGSHSKQMSNQLRYLGKPISPRNVRRQGEIQIVKRANFLENFLRWRAAFHLAGNGAGDELVELQMEMFMRRLKRALNPEPPSETDLAEQILQIRQITDRVL